MSPIPMHGLKVRMVKHAALIQAWVSRREDMRSIWACISSATSTNIFRLSVHMLHAFPSTSPQEYNCK
eukprot:4685030-Amphidinium_carterae.1